MQLMTFARTLSLLFALALVVPACGAQIQEEKSDGSNFNADDWKQEEKPVVAIAPKEKEDTGPRDPDGLLHRVSPELHPQLAEIRIDTDKKILLIFRSGEAIKLPVEDLDQIHIVEAKAGKMLVRVRTQEFNLTASP